MYKWRYISTLLYKKNNKKILKNYCGSCFLKGLISWNDAFWNDIFHWRFFGDMASVSSKLYSNSKNNFTYVLCYYNNILITLYTLLLLTFLWNVMFNLLQVSGYIKILCHLEKDGKCWRLPKIPLLHHYVSDVFFASSVSLACCHTRYSVYSFTVGATGLVFVIL